jgi:hypothetical protein
MVSSRIAAITARKAPWTPALLTGLVFYFDAFDQLDASATWTARLGSFTASQSTSGSRPTWSALGKNGLPAVRFDGTDDCLNLSATTGFPTSTAASFTFTVGFDSDSGSTNRQIFTYGSGTSSQDRHIRRNTTKVIAAGINGTTVLSASVWSLSNAIVGYDQSATTGTLYVNGGAAETGGMVPATVATRARIGASAASTATLFWNGYVQTLILLNASPSTSDRQKLEGWGAHTFGLRSLLPTTHPHYGRPPTASAEDIERFMDDLRDIPFSTRFVRERYTRLYTPERKLIAPDNGWRLAA